MQSSDNFGSFWRGALILLALVLWTPGTPQNLSCQSTKPGRQVWSAGVAFARYTLVQDAGSDNTLLVDEGSGVTTGGRYVPVLVALRCEDGKAVSRTPLESWRDFIQAHHLQALPGQFYPHWDPAFLFLRPPTSVLLIQAPWLAVVDLNGGLIVRSVLASPDLTDPNSPARHVALQKPVPMGVVVSPDRRYVAAAFNLGPVPRVFIFNSDLTRQVRSWSLSRYVKDLAWSPDGRRLAVLYDGKFDRDGTFVGEFPKQMPVRLPDVAVFDAATGGELVSFFTGGPEAEIAFSPDGSLIYTISETSNVTTLQRDGVRAFSASSGDLRRILGTEGKGVHDEFAISRDGRFIAANASTDLWHPFFTEAHAFGNVSRFVLMDSATGRVIFSRREKTSVAYPLNPIFSPDGRLLFVQFGPGRSRRERPWGAMHVVAYSVEGL